MNVNQFVSAREPEIARFVNFLEQTKNNIPSRLTTPHPVRPASFSPISRRALPHSPFRNCGQFLENTSVALMKATKPRKVKMTITDELKEKIHVKEKRITKRIPLYAEKSNNKKKTKLNSKQKLQKRLLMLRRKKAKRRLIRARAVSKFGYRRINNVATSGKKKDDTMNNKRRQQKYRLYLPCHRYLAKRFKFVDVSTGETSSRNTTGSKTFANSRLENAKAVILSQFNHRCNDDVAAHYYEVSLRVPYSSCTSKTYRRIQKARQSDTCAIFDLSYQFVTTFIGAVNDVREIGDLLRRKNLISAKSNTNSVVPIGDGRASLSSSSSLSSASLVNIAKGLNLLTVVVSRDNYHQQQQQDQEQQQDSDGGILCFIVTTSCESLQKIFEQKRQERKVFDDADDGEDPEDNSTINNDKTSLLSSSSCASSTSPFCLLIEGTTSKDKAESLLMMMMRNSGTSIINRTTKNSIIRDVATISIGRRTLILDLSLLTTNQQHQQQFVNTTNSCSSNISTGYKAFQRLFRDAVIGLECVPGGSRDY